MQPSEPPGPEDKDAFKAAARGPLAWMAKNSVAANLLMLVVVLGGLAMAPRVKQEVFPEFDLDIISVTVPYPGASPTEVEQGVLLALEEAVRGLDGVKRVRSTASESLGSVTIELLLGADPDRVLADVKSAVDRVTSLPEEAEKPEVSLLAMKAEVISVILSGDQPEATLREYATRLREKLLEHPQITMATVAGVREPEISVEVPSENLRRYGLTLEQVAAAVRATSVDLPGGAIKTDRGEILVRTTERRETGAELADVVVLSRPDGTEVRLGEIANVRDEFKQSDKRAYFFKKPAAMVKVFRVGDQKPVELTDAVRSAVAEFPLPEGIEAHMWADWSEFFRDRVDLLRRNATFGFFLVLLVLGMFLNIKLAFWVTLGIPISFAGSMLVLPHADVSLNMISLFAYIITLGIVVDDAIVVGEAIFYRRQQDMPPLKAAIVGVRDVAVPVVFSVLTTIIFFAPMLFVPGMMGKFMRVLPVIVISVLALSLFESLFILPAHLAHSQDPDGGGLFGPIHRLQHRLSRALETFVDRRFIPVLEVCLRRRYLTLSVAVAVFVSAVGLVAGGRVPSSFFPKIDGDLVFAQVALPYGTPAAETQKVHDRLVDAAYALLEEYGGAHVAARGMFHQVGAADNAGIKDPLRPGMEGSHLTEVGLFLVPEDQRSFSSREFSRRWREALGEVAGAESVSFRYDTGAPSPKPVAVQLFHSDLKVLERAASDLARALTQFDGLYDIEDGFETGKEQLDFTLRPEGRALGLTELSLAQQLRNRFFGIEATRQQRGRDEVRTYVRLPESERLSEWSVERLLLRTPSGGEVPLGRAADVRRGRAYTRIGREDGRRVAVVAAELDSAVANGDRMAATLESELLPELKERYPGLSFRMGGEQRDQAETMESLGAGSLMALVAMYGLLAIVFRSYWQPLVVVSVIPFGAVGAILGHMLMGYYVSMMSFFGMVALFGIVVNDSLVLIDAINGFRAAGMGTHEALIEGARRRFRPILLTSATTFLGLVPMLTETSMQARFLIPMAISLAFGVLLATIICPVLVPITYAIFEDLLRARKEGLGVVWEDELEGAVPSAEE